MKSEWTPLATDFFHHPKVVEVDGSAKLLFLAGLCYAQHHLTDGVVPRRATRHLLAQVEADDDAVDQLVSAGLWTTEADGYRVPNWSEWNQPAESVREKRQRESNRKSQWRAAKKAKNGDAGRDASRDASGDADRDGDATRPRRSTPTPTPTPTENSLPDNHLAVVPAPAPDARDDDRRVGLAAAKLAQHDLDAARTRGEHITSPGGFKESRRKAWTESAVLAEMAASHPDDSATELAALVLDVCGLDDPTESLPEQEAFSAITERNRRREAGQACPDCDDTGVVLDDTNTARPCPCQKAAS